MVGYRSRAGIRTPTRRAIACLAALLVSAVVVWPASAAAAPSPPFSECPAVGSDTSCGLLIVVNSDGSTSTYVDPAQGPLDDTEDVLVGVLNNSPSRVTSLPLSGSGIFAFDDDGLCAAPNAPSGCPFGATGYEGPNTSFNFTDENDGSVTFSGGLAPAATAYFSLEGLAGSVLTSPGVDLGTLDLDGFCRAVGFASAALSGPQQGPGAAYGNWTCVAPNGTPSLLDLQQACAWGYAQQPLLARPTDPNDAYTWRC